VPFALIGKVFEVQRRADTLRFLYGSKLVAEHPEAPRPPSAADPGVARERPRAPRVIAQSVPAR
jgi:hypothetical protein